MIQAVETLLVKFAVFVVNHSFFICVCVYLGGTTLVLWYRVVLLSMERKITVRMYMPLPLKKTLYKKFTSSCPDSFNAKGKQRERESMRVSFNHQSVCFFLTIFIVVNKAMFDTDNNRLHIIIAGGLLVALTISIGCFSRVPLRSGDAYGALTLPWLLILQSSSSLWLKYGSLISSFSYVVLLQRMRTIKVGTWKMSRCDPICTLAKMLARNISGNDETELGVLFLCMQGLSIASVSVFYDVFFTHKGITWLPWSEGIEARERVLVSAFLVASCWLSFSLLTLRTTTSHQYILGCMFMLEMFLSVGILDALFSQIRGNNTRETLTVFNLSRLAALWFAGVCSSLVLVRRRIRKEKILSGRKMFHAIAVVMFGLPMHFWRDDYGQILIPVAFATCLVLFCSIEYLRVSQRWSNITRLIFAWEKKKKRSDEVVVLSHSSLLLGMAAPLWLRRGYGKRSIGPLAGLISIGIGDTFACEVGSKFGRFRISDTSTKTFEGFLAFFVSTFTAASLLVSEKGEYNLAMASLAGALVECTLEESALDNLVIPLVFLTFT